MNTQKYYLNTNTHAFGFKHVWACIHLRITYVQAVYCIKKTIGTETETHNHFVHASIYK